MYGPPQWIFTTPRWSEVAQNVDINSLLVKLASLNMYDSFDHRISIILWSKLHCKCADSDWRLTHCPQIYPKWLLYSNRDMNFLPKPAQIILQRLYTVHVILSLSLWYFKVEVSCTKWITCYIAQAVHQTMKSYSIIRYTNTLRHMESKFKTPVHRG